MKSCAADSEEESNIFEIRKWAMSMARRQIWGHPVLLIHGIMEVNHIIQRLGEMNRSRGGYRLGEYGGNLQAVSWEAINQNNSGTEEKD